MQELDRLIAKANRARELYEKRLERAEKLAAEMGRDVQPRLPLGDDLLPKATHDTDGEDIHR